MITYPKILFPVNLSKQSQVVADHVATMIDKFDSELHLVHVIANFKSPTFASVSDVMDEIKHKTLKELDAFAASHFPHVTQVTKVLIGHSGRQILNPGREWPKRPPPPDRTARTGQVSRSSISN